MTSNSGGGEREVWRTAIADAASDDICLRGYSLLELMDKADFVSVAFLVFKGEFPTDAQRELFSTALVACVDHGISPSATVSRFIAGAGSPIQASVAGGLLTFGDIHAGAGEEMCRILEAGVERATSDADLAKVAAEIVAERRAAKSPLPGYGHPQHPEGDPRVPVLIRRAEQLDLVGSYLTLAIELDRALERSLGRRIPMNIDGVLSGIHGDMGFSWRHSRPLAMMSRIVGLAAHAIEESVRENGWRQLAPEDIVYDGARGLSVANTEARDG